MIDYKNLDNNISIDTETLGLGDNPAVIQLAAVRFNVYTGEIFESFNRAIDIESAMAHGKVQPATLRWWLNQPRTLQNGVGLTASNNDPYAPEYAITPVPLEVALAEFAGSGLFNNAGRLDANVWGHEESDFKWWTNAMRAVVGEPDFSYYQSRGIRTLAQTAAYCGMPVDETRAINYAKFGDNHDALTDATAQAKHIAKLMRFIMDKGE